MALLGELHFRALSAEGGFNLPREGGVAYAAQESWVLNATIKVCRIPSSMTSFSFASSQDNILFGAAYDKERLDKVIYQTGLLRDLSLFEAAELTEIGEKGITLRYGLIIDVRSLALITEHTVGDRRYYQLLMIPERH